MTACRYANCGTLVSSKKIACDPHWFELPAHLRQGLAAEYTREQEFGTPPSDAWLAALAKIDAWWEKHRGRRKR